MGLANRVVLKGKAVEEAMKVAEMLVEFPQLCMNRGRESCYSSIYQTRSLQNALAYEFDQREGSYRKREGIDGARRFAGGRGQSGKL